MSVGFIKTIQAVEKLIATNQHEYFAAKFLNIATSNIILLVQSYAIMQEKRPIKYQDEILSGSMVRNFKKAISSEIGTAEDIVIIANYKPVLENMIKAVKYCNKNVDISEEAAERAALSILTSLFSQHKRVTDFRRAAKDRMMELFNEAAADDELVALSLKTKLNENYLK